MSTLGPFLLGALAMASFVAALCFLRFWRTSRERLFLYFALAFATLAVDWSAIALVTPTAGTGHYVFVVRLLAFALIIGGIVDKNRRPVD